MKFGKELWEIKHLAEVYLGVSDLVEAQMGMSVFFTELSFELSEFNQLNFEPVEFSVTWVIGGMFLAKNEKRTWLLCHHNLLFMCHQKEGGNKCHQGQVDQHLNQRNMKLEYECQIGTLKN